MTHRLDWRARALDQMAGYLADDPDGVRAVLTVVDELVEEPYPPYATKIGAQYRARTGRYRIVYEVDDTEVTVIVVHIGRTGSP